MSLNTQLDIKLDSGRGWRRTLEWGEVCFGRSSSWGTRRLVLSYSSRKIDQSYTSSRQVAERREKERNEFFQMFHSPGPTSVRAECKRSEKFVFCSVHSDSFMQSGGSSLWQRKSEREYHLPLLSLYFCKGCLLLQLAWRTGKNFYPFSSLREMYSAIDHCRCSLSLILPFVNFYFAKFVIQYILLSNLHLASG